MKVVSVNEDLKWYAKDIINMVDSLALEKDITREEAIKCVEIATNAMMCDIKIQGQNNK